MKIYEQDQSISQWFKYLSTGSKVDKSVPGNITFVIGYENKCHKIYLNDQNTEVVVSPVPELYSNQEEADTRMLLHCKYINTSSENIVISCPDTDVFVLSLYFCMDIPAKLYFHRCKGGKSSTVALCQIYQHFGKDVCDALIGCHCISRCDTVSSFHGIGKKRAFASMKSN